MQSNGGPRRDPWHFQRWAYQQQVGNPTRKLILVALATICESGTGYGFVSQDDLADYAECSERSVRRHLEALEEAGLVARRHEYRAGGGRLADGFLLLDGSVAEWPDGQAIPDNLTARAYRTDGGGIADRAVSAQLPSTTALRASSEAPSSARAREGRHLPVDESVLSAAQVAVLDSLRRVREAKGADLDEEKALDAVRAYQDRDHVGEAQALEHWCLRGKGQNRRRKDLNAMWRRWLREAAPVDAEPAPRRRNSGPDFEF